MSEWTREHVKALQEVTAALTAKDAELVRLATERDRLFFALRRMDSNLINTPTVDLTVDMVIAGPWHVLMAENDAKVAAESTLAEERRKLTATNTKWRLRIDTLVADYERHMKEIDRLTAELAAAHEGERLRQIALTRLTARWEALKAPYAAHKQHAVDCNFTYCGCDFCKPLRDEIEPKP